MDYNYKTFFILCLTMATSCIMAQNTHKTTTTTTTTTVNGHTTKTYSSSDNQIINYSYVTKDDKWKVKEISKEMDIKSHVPIFIESAYRTIEIKTWDQPTIKIVARARFQNENEANKDFDYFFEKAKTKIKSSDEAFEILGANNSINYYPIRSMKNIGSATFRPLAYAGVPGATAIAQGGNNIVITTPNFNYNKDGDTIMFHNDSATTQLRVFMKSKESILKAAKEKQIALIEKAQKLKEKISAEKLSELTKKLSQASEKLARLSLEKSEKNNSEITKLNQQIGQLSNQIAFQSLEKIPANFDSIININFQPANNDMEFNTVNDGEDDHNLQYAVNNSANDSSKLKWTIYIPKDHKISIESKYGDIVLENDLNNVKISSKYANVQTKNIENLTLQNEYGNVFTGDIQNADIEFRNGNLKMQNVHNLDIESKNAGIDLDDVYNMKMESSNDNYDITSVRELDADKKYGNLRLTSLKGNLQFNGANADIKIRSIAPSVSKIDIDNKFAKIAIPLSDSKNYRVFVSGNYNTSYDDFNIDHKDDKGFEASKGNGNDLTATINCNNCQLDFK